jgi:4-aminobutyrate aminotransferase/(S)-3-amino-2-methylpropionate transaminase
MDPKSTDRAEDLLRRREAVLPRGVSRLNRLVAESASGAEIVDVNGRRFLDLATGIGVMSVGHSRRSVLDAAEAQIEKLQHACIHVATYEPYVRLAERLVEKLPHGGPTKVFLANSGAEAVENAVKIARQKTGRSGIICFTESFHGRTLLCLSLTSKVGYKKGCGPFAPEIYRLPFPNHYKHGGGRSLEAFAAAELERFEQALVSYVEPGAVAAVIIEVVQGEGGFVPCPLDFLRGLREITSRHGIMLIVDEVQTGFCRTGKWAAFEHAGIVPDLSTWAKAMGGGLPIAAVVGKADVMDAALPGTLGGTYGGNPVACASALAAIDLMEREDLAARAWHLGGILAERLERLEAQCPIVGDARGLGAMRAIELVDGDRPNTKAAADIIERCFARGVLLIGAGAYGNIIRLLPPLSITDAELERALTVLEEEVRR